MGKDNNVIFDTQKELFVKSTTDGLYIMPWRLLHDGYQVTRQETVVSVDPDAGIPITHSRFSAGGRIISAKIYVDTEEHGGFGMQEPQIIGLCLVGFMMLNLTDLCVATYLNSLLLSLLVIALKRYMFNLRFMRSLMQFRLRDLLLKIRLKELLQRVTVL